MSTSKHFVFGVVFILLALTSKLNAQTEAFTQKWERVNFAEYILDLKELEGLSLVELKYLRGIVFGRHGRRFGEPVIQDYLNSRPWYKPNPNYNPSVLNPIERKNMDTIKEAEWRKHPHIDPGDLRFYRDRLIKEEELGEHTEVEWRIMRAEIEALHGKTFDDAPWLQQFFEERYWYKPNYDYDPSQLSEIERRNLAMIIAAANRQKKLVLAPGEMDKFQDKLITEDMLKGLGLYELRILRNEIYARRGRRFRTPWIEQYFYSQPWYKPLPDFREPQLSAIETKNIATIVNLENKIHEELSAKPISQELLQGLFLEDARKLRNEIYARHGKVFKDKWLQSYFASFKWYKPDPSFSESALNGIERQNVATILAYERTAESEMSRVAA
ncbi:YARHG domain-containing protein [candidate division KSB1 bacterium]|nr:YARHG domain-containing protein [candidate division KSB1 bacterium]